MKRARVAGGVLGAVAAVCLAGCSLGAAAGGASVERGTASGSFEKLYESGVLKVRIRVYPTTIDTAGQVVLDVRSDVPAGWTLQEPTIGSKLGKFSVADRQTLPTKNLGGNLIRTESAYRLDPFLPGAYEIPSLTVAGREGTKRLSVTTKPVAITVTSLIPKGAKTPLRLKSLAGPVGVPSTFPEIFAGMVTLLAVVAATVFFLVGRFRKKRQSLEQSIPAWIRATRALDHLVSLDLPGRGKHKEFYDSISMLVRRYIEEMFDLNAPELTTEEFLYELRDSSSLGRHRRFLEDFLSHCDMVKFAAYLPAQDEIHRAVRSCRAFIDSTSRDYSGRAESESM